MASHVPQTHRPPKTPPRPGDSHSPAHGGVKSSQLVRFAAAILSLGSSRIKSPSTPSAEAAPSGLAVLAAERTRTERQRLLRTAIAEYCQSGEKQPDRTQSQVGPLG